MLLGLNLKHLIFVLPNKCHLGKIECVNLVGKGKGIKGAMRNNESYSVMKSIYCIDVATFELTDI